MPGHQNRSSIFTLERSSHDSGASDCPQDALKPETQRSSLLNTSESSSEFDTQVAVLPLRFHTMTRITAVDTTTGSKVRLETQRRTDNTGNGGTEDAVEPGGDSGSVDPPLSARKSGIKPDQRRPQAGGASGKFVQTEQPIGLVVALFHDGFVCRHINKENEGVEGFAQPYDAESSYFLACIDNGRVPEGLPDMIACAHYNGSVLAEIRDYREMRTALCPVSSAFLPAASALSQANDSEGDTACHVWQTLLLPGKSLSPIHAQIAALFEPQSIFDHFPDVTPGELETLAMDAKRQLLQEEDVLLSSSSTESSSPRDEPRRVGFFSAELQDAHINGKKDEAEFTTTPTTRSRFHSGLDSSPPASLLSPIERKSACSSLNAQEENSTKRCKRQIQTKVKGIGKHNDSQSKHEAIRMKIESTPNSGGSGASYQGLDMCESPMSPRSLPPRRGYLDLLTDDTASVTPLPATQLFLAKLKGKRRRPNNELLYGKPTWVTIAHVGRFFRAATRLEREHSRFLHVNARRLMQAEKPPPAETEHVAGSMRHLSRQLGTLTRPSDVIAVAGARELKVAEDEGRELRKSDWMDNGESSPTPSWQPTEVAVAMVNPDNEPAMHLQRMDKDEEILLGHFIELATDIASLMQDSQPPAAAPHFNAFDDDGNLQLQSA